MTHARPITLFTAAAAGAATLLAMSGCVAKTPVEGAAALSVVSTADLCEVSAPTAPSGTLTFTVRNDGDQVTEFYLLADDALRIVGEVENIAPGAERTLTLVAQPGEYVTLCKPGMLGTGVGQATLTVTGDRVELAGSDSEEMQRAVELYAAFVKDQVEQLVPAAEAFTAAYAAGDDEAARAQFPLVRAHYERIEPIAEALGDLDPRIDYREVDAKAEDLEWTGFHRIEKDLWQPAADALNADGMTPAWQDWEPSNPQQRAVWAKRLNDDIAELNDYVHSDEFIEALTEQGAAGLSNGAIALLDEVASGKITGEEDWWSGTDLYDFAANVEGSKMAYSLVRDLAAAKGDDAAALLDRIDRGYAALEAKLATYGSLQQGFIGYGDLTDQDRRDLTDLINTLAEPLSQLTVTILS